MIVSVAHSNRDMRHRYQGRERKGAGRRVPPFVAVDTDAFGIGAGRMKGVETVKMRTEGRGTARALAAMALVALPGVPRPTC